MLIRPQDALFLTFESGGGAFGSGDEVVNFPVTLPSRIRDRNDNPSRNTGSLAPDSCFNWLY
jgi:hypothetical protein